MKKSEALKLSMSGLIGGLVCVFTAFLKIPSQIGYMHLGDGFVLSAGVFLGPMGIIAAGIGSALADILTGYAIYAVPTFFIKCLTSFLSFRLYKMFKERTVILIVGLVLTQTIMTILYFLYEWIIYGIGSALGSTFFTSIQAIIGVIIGIVLIRALEKIGIEKLGIER